MKKIFFLMMCMSLIGLSGFAQNKVRLIGTVTDGKSPIENVKVLVDGENSATTTDIYGRYQLDVSTGDVVVYSYTGLKTVRIKIEDVTRVLNPVLIPDVTELNEVTVQASKRRSQTDLKEDYIVNKNIIRTAWGYLDADRAAGNIRILTEDEINPISLCILDLLRNRFAGIEVTGSCTTGGITPDIGEIGSLPLQVGGQVRIRPGNSLTSALPAVFDVDGQIFTDVPVWLDINSIKRIAILANLATTASYGNLGAGGVIVINTIGGNPQPNVFVDRARLKNNYADGKELTRAEVAENEPTYLKELRASASLEDAKSIFNSYIKKYSNSPYFILDAYTYFAEVRKDMTFADSIITDFFDAYIDNPVLMKALAYIYESQQRFEKANDAYKEVFILRPNYAQSFLDMANSYRNLRKPKMAASMYARYEYLINEGFMEQDTLGFGPILEREYNNLLMLEKNTLVNDLKTKKLFIAEEDFKGTRLVFEWNDGEADFDLQFVNPENQYYTWKHSMFDNADLITREKDLGYNMTEYLVDGAIPGTWKLNVNYLGNKSLTPTYLKATIYSNYGTIMQQKEVKVFKLSLKKVNQRLFTVQSASKVVYR